MSKTPSPAQPSLFVPAHLSWQRTIMRGEVVYVCTNDLSGEHFATDQNTYNVMSGLADGIPLAQVFEDSRIDRQAFAKVLPSLLQAGVVRAVGGSATLQADGKSSSKPKPIESRLLFARWEFLEVGRFYPWMRPLVSFLFSRLGLVVFGGLFVVALDSLVTNRTTLYANMASVDIASASVVIGLAIIFLTLKALHEIWHALATAHFLKAESKNVPPIRAGLALFFIFPFPFTNTSASWQLVSKWRRAAIGAAGIYIEMWVAVLAAIIWAQIGESDIQTALFQVMFVAGVSTVVFNLNPLIRLDGYYILTDVMEMPNLATRSAQAARSLGMRLLGAGGGTSDASLSLVVYWVLSLVYRCFMFAAIFFIAMATDPALAAGVALVALLVLVGRPALSTYRAARQSAGEKPLGVHARVLSFCILGAVCLFIPVENALILDGRVEFKGLRHIYSEVPGRLSLRPAGPIKDASTAVVTVTNSELHHKEAIAQKEYRLAELNYRRSLARGPEELEALRQELASAQKKIDEVRRQKAQTKIPAGTSGMWIPARAGAFDLAWNEPGLKRAIGVVVPDVNPVLTAELDQETAEIGLRELVGRPAMVRFPGLIEDFIKAEVVSVARVARGQTHGTRAGDQPDGRSQSVFKVKLQPLNGEIPRVVQLEGKRFVARVGSDSKPLWQIAWLEIERLAQKRFRLQPIE